MSIEIPTQLVVLFTLASTRLLAAFFVAPVFGHGAIPMRVRGALALLVTGASFGIWADGAVAIAAVPLAFAMLREVLIGIAMGTALSLVFSGIALMGEFASIQGGLGAASVLDPTSGASSLVVSTLSQAFVLLGFLALDGHHFILRLLFRSFEWFPVGGAAVDPAGFGALASAGANVFEIAVRFAAPITAVMLVSNTAVGMLGRAIPQLNLMSLHLPGQILLLFVMMLFAAAPWTETAVRAVFEHGEATIAAFAGVR